MSKASRESIKKNVLDAFQEAEEMGGVDNHNEYTLLIAELIAELSSRLRASILTNTNDVSVL